ncbi:uncharacterized protein DS421_13g406200 [Arachis hypogaea]|nr:uncharacterized protein DS421_13g406200 [Arachis hypogaea]
MAAVIGTEGERETESSRWGKRQAPLCCMELSLPFLPPAAAALPGCVESRRRAWPPKNPLLSSENSSGAIAGVWSPLLLEVAAGLLLNRFGDRHCSGLAVPSSVRVVEVIAKVAGT